MNCLKVRGPKILSSTSMNCGTWNCILFYYTAPWARQDAFYSSWWLAIRIIMNRLTFTGSLSRLVVLRNRRAHRFFFVFRRRRCRWQHGGRGSCCLCRSYGCRPSSSCELMLKLLSYGLKNYFRNFRREARGNFVRDPNLAFDVFFKVFNGLEAQKREHNLVLKRFPLVQV